MIKGGTLLGVLLNFHCEADVLVGEGMEPSRIHDNVFVENLLVVQRKSANDA